MDNLWSLEGPPLIFGHRGYSSLAPENTMAAFDLCVERGIPGIELDVHVCKSGELVIIHDHELKRLANIEGTVEEMTYAQLRELDVGSHKDSRFSSERIPMLNDLLSRHGNSLCYDIELKVRGTKDTGIAIKTWEAIKSAHLEAVCMVSSFNPFALRRFNAASQRSIPTAVIYCEDEDVPRILQHGWGRHIARASVLKPESRQVDAKMIERFWRHKRYPVVPWTVDDPDEGLRLIRLGVRGLISNNPGLFMDHR